MSQIVVSVIEDHPLYRAALVQALGEAPDVTVGVQAGSVEEFAAYRADPDNGVAILDLQLPGARDAQAVVTVVGSGYRVLVVSANGDRQTVLAAIAAGARGYLTKNADSAEILRAVREVAAGNSYVSPTLASYLLDSSRDRPAVRLPLTDRERQVLALVAAGERDQDIADALHISLRTVRSHLDRIREKTGQRRRAGLASIAIAQGIVPHA